MDITASSSRAEIIDQYLANIDYATAGAGADESAAISQAKLFRQAVHALLLRPRDSRHGQGSQSFDTQALRDQLAAVEAFLASRAGDGRATRAGFTSFRT
jgi:hypothetical protein